MIVLVGLAVVNSFAETTSPATPIDSLKAQLKSKNPSQRKQALYKLSEYYDPEAVALIASSLKDPVEFVRIHACFILGTLKKKETLQSLVNVVLYDKSQKVTIHCAEALVNMGYQKAIGFILDGLKRKDPMVALLALEKLEVIANPVTTKPLEEYLRSTTDPMLRTKTERVIQILKGELSKENVAKARNLIDQADQAVLKGNITTAKQLLGEAQKLDPKNSRVYYVLGNIYAKYRESYPEAVANLKKAADYGFVELGEVYYRLGQLLIELKKSGEAVQYLTKAAQFLHSAEAYYNLAVAYANLPDNDHAVQYCHKALELDPNFIYAHFLLSKLYALKNDPEKAELHQKRYEQLTQKR